MTDGSGTPTDTSLGSGGVAARYRPRSLVVLLLPLLVGVVAAALYVVRRSRPVSESLVLVPFTTLGPDSDTAYLADGLPDSLAATLALLPRLRVVNATGLPASHYLLSDLPKLGRTVAADAVASGTIERRGESVALQITLTSVASNTELWSGSYVRPLSGLLALHQETAAELARRLHSGATAAETAGTIGRLTRDVVAFRLYLKGRHYLRTRTAASRRNAIANLAQAAAQDRSWALASAALAEAYAVAGAALPVAAREPDEAGRAEAAALRAVELGPALAEAHAALGAVQHRLLRRRAAAETAFRRAIALRPSYPAAHHWLGELLLEDGRFHQAGSELERALELDPFSCSTLNDRGRLALFSAAHEQAIDRFREALAIDERSASARLGLARAYAFRGMLAESLAELGRARDSAPWAPLAIATECSVLAGSGHFAEARERLAHLVAESPGAAFARAVACAGLGDTDGALVALAAACDERSPQLGTVGVDPVFELLRGDVRFVAILRCTGLTPPRQTGRSP